MAKIIAIISNPEIKDALMLKYFIMPSDLDLFLKIFWLGVFHEDSFN